MTVCPACLAPACRVVQTAVSKGQCSVAEVVQRAVSLVDRFVRPGSEYEINVDSTMTNRLIKAVQAAVDLHGLGSGSVEAASRSDVSDANRRPVVVQVRPTGLPPAEQQHQIISPISPSANTASAAAITAESAALGF